MIKTSRTLPLAISCASVLLLALSPVVAEAQQPRHALGVRGLLFVADGEPANDIPGVGVFGLYSIGDRWAIGGAIEQTEYDFEEPARLLGLTQDPRLEPIDVLAEGTVISAWLERRYNPSGGTTTWYWSVGLGAASIDVPNAVGPLATSGRFDIETDAGTELLASVGAGLRRNLGRRFLLDFGVRADQHFADWKLQDRISGRRGTVSDYTAFGSYLGLGFRF